MLLIADLNFKYISSLVLMDRIVPYDIHLLFVAAI